MGLTGRARGDIDTSAVDINKETRLHTAAYGANLTQRSHQSHPVTHHHPPTDAPQTSSVDSSISSSPLRERSKTRRQNAHRPAPRWTLGSRLPSDDGSANSSAQAARRSTIRSAPGFRRLSPPTPPAWAARCSRLIEPMTHLTRPCPWRAAADASFSARDLCWKQWRLRTVIFASGAATAGLGRELFWPPVVEQGALTARSSCRLG